MSNTLKMEKQILIQQLLTLGWSYRKIEAETGIRRETVAKYDPNHPANKIYSKPAKVPAGSSGRVSRCEPWRAVITAKLGQGLSAQRIWQDLVAEHGFGYSYDSVKRFLRRLGKVAPLPFRIGRKDS